MGILSRKKDEQTALIELLNGLIALDFDAIEAYEAAIDRLKMLADQEQLRLFERDHVENTESLSVIVRELGGEPAKGADYKRVLTKGKVLLGGISGDHAILVAMKSNEDETNRAYERANAHAGLTVAIAGVLQKNLSDERRHRAWLEQRLRKDEQREAAHHP